MSPFGPPNVEKMKAMKDVNGLIKALRYKKDANVRRTAAEALGQIWEGIGDTRAVLPLIYSTQNDNDSTVLMAAAEALWTIGFPTVDMETLDEVSHFRDPVKVKFWVNTENAKCARCGIVLLTLTEVQEKYAKHKLGGGQTALMSMDTALQAEGDKNAIGVTCASCGHSFCTACMQKHGKPHPRSGGLACLDCGGRMKELTRT
jgi:hypothetical protein